MPRLTRYAAAALALLVASCQAPTPFQPAGRDGSNGYTVQRLEQDHFRIGFSGNTTTSRRQVEQELAYLAAQVTLRNGGDYYVIAKGKTDSASIYDPLGSRSGYPEGSVPCCFPSNAVTSSEYEAVADIVIFKGSVPENNPAAHDAREVIRDLGPVIKRGGGYSVY